MDWEDRVLKARGKTEDSAVGVPLKVTLRRVVAAAAVVEVGTHSELDGTPTLHAGSPIAVWRLRVKSSGDKKASSAESMHEWGTVKTHVLARHCGVQHPSQRRSPMRADRRRLPVAGGALVLVCKSDNAVPPSASGTRGTVSRAIVLALGWNLVLPGSTTVCHGGDHLRCSPPSSSSSVMVASWRRESRAARGTQEGRSRTVDAGLARNERMPNSGVWAEALSHRTL